MRTARSWIWKGMLVCGLVGLACGTSSSKDANAPIAAKEIGRQEIGPAGGTVTGGAVTIEIPAGALTETTTIIISEADPKARALPADTQIAGGLYVLQPDDLTFLVPVTVKVQLDPSKKRADGKGAIVLFRGTGATTAWQPYGADETTATLITGQTTHFSLWAPTAAAEALCYLRQCNGFARFDGQGRPVGRDGQPVPGVALDGGASKSLPSDDSLPGLDCKVPNDAVDKGVVCAGSGERNGPPYSCHCIGSDVSLGTWPRLPADTTIGAMAQQCGAPACAPSQQFACNLGWECTTSDCASQREPRISCSATGGPVAPGSPPPVPNPDGSWSCSCPNGGRFALPKPNASNDDIVPLWLAKCGGSCEGAGTDPNADFVCPGDIAGELPNGGCFNEPISACRDNHIYRLECDKGADDIGNCKCLVDGKVTKEVKGLCVEGQLICDWPKMQGLDNTRKCPRIIDRPLKQPPPGQAPTEPLGCYAATGGSCRDGHAYRVECPNAFPVAGPSGPTECQCFVDGAPTKKVTITQCYTEGPEACGWPEKAPVQK